MCFLKALAFCDHAALFFLEDHGSERNTFRTLGGPHGGPSCEANPFSLQMGVMNPPHTPTCFDCLHVLLRRVFRMRGAQGQQVMDEACSILQLC